MDMLHVERDLTAKWKICFQGTSILESGGSWQWIGAGIAGPILIPDVSFGSCTSPSELGCVLFAFAPASVAFTISTRIPSKLAISVSGTPYDLSNSMRLRNSASPQP